MFNFLRIAIQNQTLKQRFRLWIGSIILLLGFSIMIPFYYAEKHNTLDTTESNLKQIIGLQSLYIDQWVVERARDIKSFANSEAAKHSDIKHLNVDIQSFVSIHSEYGSIFYVNKDGYYSSETEPSKNLYVGDRKYFEAAMNLKDYISGVMTSRATGKQMITFSSPVIGEQSQFLGAVVGTVSLEVLERHMEDLNVGKTGEVFVLDENGTMVTASKAIDMAMASTVMNTEIVQRAKANAESFQTYTGYHGRKVYGLYQWSNGHNWVIVGEIDAEEVMAHLDKLLFVIILITLLALLVGLLAVFKVTSRIERPIRYLLKGTKIIQNGNYNYQIDTNKIKLAPVELKELCETYNVMSAKLKETITLLEHSALVDQLTEIHNRRYMMDEGSKLLHACIAGGQTCSVIMLDIDHYKKINDTYGHQTGDRVLRHVAFLIGKYAGPQSIIARYGGEEFIVLAFHMNVTQGAELAESLRRHIMNEPYRDQHLTVALTSSMGVAEYSPDRRYGTNLLEDMVARADFALYQAKFNGRNRIELDAWSSRLQIIPDEQLV